MRLCCSRFLISFRLSIVQKYIKHLFTLKEGILIPEEFYRGQIMQNFRESLRETEPGRYDGRSGYCRPAGCPRESWPGPYWRLRRHGGSHFSFSRSEKPPPEGDPY